MSHSILADTFEDFHRHFIWRYFFMIKIPQKIVSFVSVDP